MQAEILTTILTSSLFASIVTMVVGFIKSFFHSKKIDRMVLFFIIKTIATDAIWAGHISTEDLQFLEECYSEYKRLGGNGFADTLMNRVRVLPIKEDE
jgi:flagellar biosynthesis protein FliQ